MSPALPQQLGRSTGGGMAAVVALVHRLPSEASMRDQIISVPVERCEGQWVVPAHLSSCASVSGRMCACVLVKPD